jgi:lon-related putative ATP-dependent protease
LEELRGRAARQDLTTIQASDGGFMFVPMRNGQVIDPEAFSRLEEKERHRIEILARGFQAELEKVFQQIPKLRQERARKIRELNRRVTQVAVSALIEEVQKQYEQLPEVQGYRAEVQNDVVDHAENFRQPKEGEQVTLFGMPLPQAEAAENALRRYRVNVLVDHCESKGAPVIYEDNLTYNNLVGRIEHLQQMGVLVTDFTLIKAGALHRANGGYLIIEVLKLLQQPFAWDGLKRALRSGEIRTESLGQMLSLISTVSLEPEPIPVNVKVVLVGERLLYYLLHYFDPDFSELFKVVADFNETMESGLEANLIYARLIGSIARKEGLRQFDPTGVARVIEHSSRLAADKEKLSIEMQMITDLLREADYWAGKANRQTVTVDDVQRAIDMQQYRADRLRDRLHEEIQQGTILIDTTGEKVGQVNGLSVLQLGNFSFGNPSRITARARLGSGKVIDIEREVELGGPIHSKGVLILSGFLAGRYVPDRPLSLSASLVFEQSYAGVEGDSASSVELYALLSALAEVPIKQSIAVTGSVNQHGEIQAIGGVNEKIVGFFDVCKAQGLTGDQGVLIPAANPRHLMLRQEVIDAAAAGKFHIYAVETIDDGIEILTGLAAGRRNEHGKFPEHSINQKVEQRLIELPSRRGRSWRAAPKRKRNQ